MQVTIFTIRDCDLVTQVVIIGFYSDTCENITNFEESYGIYIC